MPDLLSLQDMMREDVVFGPVKSRRLGRSLGINLLPTGGKVCNFDCIYCECGWNRDGRTDEKLPDATRVRRALEDKLAEMLLDGTQIDAITFSGDGEPTLNPDFAVIVDDTIKLRDAYCPGVKVSVLTNATRIDDPEVFEALRKVDNPILKLDASDNTLAALINNPAPGYDVDKTVAAMEKFNGDFVLQTMFLKSPYFDSSDPENLAGWTRIVRRLKPREIMVYTVDRPAPEEGLEKFTEEAMKKMVAPLLREGFKIQIKG